MPPSASSKRPRRRALAPAGAAAPRAPNSSLSMTPSASAPQLTQTKRSLRRGLFWWMACATSPLPVPVSPSISTVARVEATWRTCSITPTMARECPVEALEAEALVELGLHLGHARHQGLRARGPGAGRPAASRGSGA